MAISKKDQSTLELLQAVDEAMSEAANWIADGEQGMEEGFESWFTATPSFDATHFRLKRAIRKLEKKAQEIQ